ncbi:MAG TPA: glycosyltransferase, partial [Anaerolineales bacterium]|nr:glycosyltransferase [Anaerolineales bacterium]
MTDIPLNDLSFTRSGQRRPAKSLLVLTPETDRDSMLAFARCLSVFSPVLVLGVVPISPGTNVSAGAAAAGELRKAIRAGTDRVNLRAKARVRVTATPWDEVRLALANEPEINLLILQWPAHMEHLDLNAAELLAHPPCDIAMVRGPFPDRLRRILVPNLGDPHAERALRLSLALVQRDNAAITSLHIRHPERQEAVARTFAGMQQVLEEMPDIDHQVALETDPGEKILDASRDFDLVVMGTKAAPAETESSLGAITDRIMQASPAAVIAVKTKRPVPDDALIQLESKAISVLVDRWFAENTFHTEEFANLAQLVELKAERGVTISLALPALNEEETIGDIIRSTQRLLVEQYPLLDEIVLVDSNSTDRTREIAADLGVPVHIHQDLLPEHGARDGKGEALWKSLFVTKGDILVWVDTDIVNF